ncbi:LysE family translocator [Stenotrophomonas lactitubi]|uniref:LysE family translocator n=2 Tax=Stenotrophomonas TaxID=40323 RepID=UPI0033421E0F
MALLLPGPDFFLVARTSLSSGWRIASGACLGIAMANGVFIITAFAGTAVLRPGSTPFVILQAAGCTYLLYLGILFVRHAGATGLEQVRASSHPSSHPSNRPARQARAWLRATGMGFLSGILNPKNALFYTSLASMLSGPHASAGWKAVYGLWMFGVVLLWDLMVAGLIGNRAVLQRFSRALPWLQRGSGVMLIALSAGVISTLLMR